MKVQHIQTNYSYSSFVTEPPTVKPLKFDQTLDRDKAMQRFLKIPEGAPFWKYNVKDEVVTAPVKAYKISENPALNHNAQYAEPKENEEDEHKHFKCGRLEKRIKALENKYNDLAKV